MDPVTTRVLSGCQAGGVHSAPKLDKGMMIPISGGMAWDSVRVRRAAQHAVQFKAYESHIAGIYYLIFLDHGGPWVRETTESKTMDKERLL